MVEAPVGPRPVIASLARHATHTSSHLEFTRHALSTHRRTFDHVTTGGDLHATSIAAATGRARRPARSRRAPGANGAFRRSPALHARLRVPVTLALQLAALKLAPADIRYVGAVASACGPQRQCRAVFAGDLPGRACGSRMGDRVFDTRRRATRGRGRLARGRIQPVPGDLDVFGDGTVRLIATPGRTPGHHSLLVRLRKTGPVLLFRRRRALPAQLRGTGAARQLQPCRDARVDRTGQGLAAHEHARVIVQHAADVFDTLPKLPNDLD